MRLTILTLAAALLLLLSPAAYAATVTIDFEDGTDFDSFGDHYLLTKGVDFGTTPGDNEGLWFDVGANEPGMSGTFFIFHSTLFGVPTAANPIIALFDGPVSEAAIVGISVGFNGAQMNAYDALVGGTLVDFDVAYGSTALGKFDEPHPLSVTGTGIRRLELFLPGPVTGGGLDPDDLVGWDTLVYTQGTTPPSAIPLPSAAWAGLGLLGLLGAIRRRRRMAE